MVHCWEHSGIVPSTPPMPPHPRGLTGTLSQATKHPPRRMLLRSSELAGRSPALVLQLLHLQHWGTGSRGLSPRGAG